MREIIVKLIYFKIANIRINFKIKLLLHEEPHPALPFKNKGRVLYIKFSVFAESFRTKE